MDLEPADLESPTSSPPPRATAELASVKQARALPRTFRRPDVWTFGAQVLTAADRRRHQLAGLVELAGVLLVSWSSSTSPPGTRRRPPLYRPYCGKSRE
jgi:hypothetical protein